MSEEMYIKAEKEYEELSKEMVVLSKFALPTENYDEEKAKLYYETRKRFCEVRNKINDYLDEKAMLNKSKDVQDTKINGYGEATNRYITSSTYERALKREQKNISSWFGIKMN